MRRPTPLPPPPGGRAPQPAAGPVPRRASPPAGTPPVGTPPGDEAPEEAPGDAAATQPLAPLIPLPTPPGPSAGAASDVASAAGGPVDAATAEPMGLRDLWRAARARRRALRAEVRRFTVRQRRRRQLWLGLLASFVVLVAATVGAAYSPLFAVERIDVVGTSMLDPQHVADALAGQVGTPLAAIDESAVKAALIAFPLVESYTLEAAPPHDLVVRIVERTPVGVVASDAGYTLYDAAGVVLSTTPEPPAGYPLLEVAGGVGSPAFAAAGRVMRALPDDIRSQVTGVTASSPDDVTLTIGGTQVVWGSAERAAYKALVLQEAMKARPGAAGYDVSSPEAVVIR